MANGSKTLVSILVPAYNAETWIRQSLDSALGQTYSPIEVIVWDDGSSDATLEIVRKYQDRVRLAEGNHAGGNVARNQLLSLASGEWVQYLDADDYLLPEKISSQMSRVAEDPDLDVIYSPILVSDEVGGFQKLLPLSPQQDISSHFIRWNALNTNGLLFKRQSLLDVGGWNPAQAACQEHELLYRLFCAGRRFSLVDNPAAVYRLHRAATVSRRDPLRTLRLKMELLDKMESHLETHRLLTQDHRKELYAARMEAARRVWSFDPASARDMARNAQAKGRWWISSSPALPLTFQLANWLFGFGGAESLAARLRGSGRVAS
jgi:glycosyltransferase involved in cell wall biosynthesis